jgi:hypothetical protein
MTETAKKVKVPETAKEMTETAKEMTETAKKVKDPDKYLDPENTPQIINRLKNSRTLGEVMTLVNEVFPDWIVNTMEVYCSDYPHLTTNWKHICRMSKSRTAQIMIVEEIPEKDDHSLINTFAECFTRAGFSVRRKREYIKCENCGSAVPNTELWQIFKEKGFLVPEKWSEKCTGCQ